MEIYITEIRSHAPQPCLLWYLSMLIQFPVLGLCPFPFWVLFMHCNYSRASSRYAPSSVWKTYILDFFKCCPSYLKPVHYSSRLPCLRKDYPIYAPHNCISPYNVTPQLPSENKPKQSNISLKDYSPQFQAIVWWISSTPSLLVPYPSCSISTRTDLGFLNFWITYNGGLCQKPCKPRLLPLSSSVFFVISSKTWIRFMRHDLPC